MTNRRFVIEEMWNPLVTNPDISSLTNLRFVSKGFHISNISSIPNIPYKDHTNRRFVSRDDSTGMSRLQIEELYVWDVMIYHKDMIVSNRRIVIKRC